MIILLDRNTDELYDQANKIQEVFSINKRWLKNPVGYYINEIDHDDTAQNFDLQFMIPQITTQKHKILNTNEKYNTLKPTLDLLTAHIIVCGTNKFMEHLNYLNILLNFININKHKKLYDYANFLKDNYFKHQDPKAEQKLFMDLCDDIQQGTTAEKVNFDYIEEFKKQSHMEFNQEEYEGQFFEEKEKDLSILGLVLEVEAKEEQDHILSKERIIFSYSPVVMPSGRHRAKASLVACKQKDDENHQNKINRKRNYKQVSTDIKRYNYKRNKKVDSVHDVYDNTTWLTDFHIYLFFELLHEQFPNINGLCGPAQIKLYTGSLKNSIFIFNANNNH
ncbi:unnamed protein product [Didymodactylos carnosus]|uniref:Uncharacterized protein n=1 Tax=Didymodactylos carnosus TaxID=1234261 RepID=A0A8S2EV30_9BILA|nr:unnamed protein product [Didymodactylos carnosus]CAF4117223.1 unnamed protein product [Didymodactylos carnosus]